MSKKINCVDCGRTVLYAVDSRCLECHGEGVRISSDGPARTNERYFVGSDGIACMVTKEFFTSFHISSSEFYKTCGAPWSDEAEYYRIMLELINCSVEITFREWCGFKYKYYVSPLNREYQWRSSGEDDKWWWGRPVDSAEWTSSLGAAPYSTLHEEIGGVFRRLPWLYEITEDEANGTGRQKMCKKAGRHLIGVKDSETWSVDEEFDSMEDAVEALDSGDYDDELFGENDIDEEYRDMHAAIGIKVDVVPQDAICADDIIEKMQEHAGEIAGDAAGDFLSRESVAGKSGELEAAVRSAILDWLTRNNLWPKFYGVDQVVSLKEAKRILDSIAIDNGGVGR